MEYDVTYLTRESDRQQRESRKSGPAQRLNWPSQLLPLEAI